MKTQVFVEVLSMEEMFFIDILRFAGFNDNFLFDF
jgi:hypothetical protein